MDIDPLKPKNVPLSADTILWFEFLLNPDLLISHLQNQNIEPSPIALIAQFLSIAREIPLDANQPPPEPQETQQQQQQVQNDNFKFNRKEIALKILSLKIAAHLKWNLELFEKNLPIRRQMQLLSYLCSVATGKFFILPTSLLQEFTVGQDGSEHALKFALFLSHLWIIRVPVVRPDRIKSFPMIMQNLQEQIRDDYIAETCFNCIPTSLDYLIKLEKSEEPFKMLTSKAFVALLDSHDEMVRQNFDSYIVLSKAELRTQINFDLCSYYLHARKYDLAKESVIRCRDNLVELKKEYNSGLPFKFCTVTDNMLHGLLLACGIVKKNPGLHERMIESSLNKFENLVAILKEDNNIKEIPIINRRIVELDIQPAISCGVISNADNVQMKTVALNTIRSVIDDGDIVSHCEFMEKFKNPKDFVVLIQATKDVLVSCSIKDRLKIKQYYLNMLLTSEMNNVSGYVVIENGVKTLELFSDAELNDIKYQRSEMDIELPAIAMQVDFKCNDMKNPILDKINLERQLINCFTPIGIRKYMVKLAPMLKKPLWGICQNWSIPIPLHSVLMQLQEGFLQDFSYILIGKARELRAKKDFAGAISLLNVIKSEVKRPEISGSNPVIAKLSKLISWEILLFQIGYSLEEWPNKFIENPEMITKCKQCLASMLNGDSVIPRMTILENCATMLLNLNDWSSIIFPDMRLPALEIILAFANVGLDKEKFKGNSKKCRDCWDYMLPMFGNAPQPIKNRNMSRDSPTLLATTAKYLYPFVRRLRDPFVISLVISLLAKLHNIMKDESNLDLNAEYMFFWPTSISNANAYNIKLVDEVLSILLQQALKFHPTNLAWIKLKGDLEFSNGNNESAMKYYVNAIIASNDFCTLHPQRAFDDFLVRRMIKCSSNLGCYMQAAVLCQFLSEIDYAAAFKNISEKNSSFSDAMDAYYTCIWDPTLLEFIVNLHSKKGEHTRKLQAISYIGQLELSANNNDEIKHEAAEIRKTQFLRALAKQYLL